MKNKKLHTIIQQAAKDEVIKLDLSCLQLTTLPPEIGQLTKLVMLELWGNQLTTLPPEIGQLSKLMKLGLYNNHIKTLPAEIGQLKQMMVLELWDNQLTTLPQELRQLNKLKTLILDNNPLVSPPPDIINQGITAIFSFLQDQNQLVTQNLVLSRLEQLDKGQQKILEGQDKLRDELKALRELTQREFTNAFRREQANIDAHCPNVFILRSNDKWRILGKTLEMQLYCQAPGCWHPLPEGGKYEIKNPAQWLKTMTPYICKLVEVLRYAAPLIGPWLGSDNSSRYQEIFRQDIDLMKELSDKLLDNHSTLENAKEPTHLQGATLRALRRLLNQQDPQQYWGGLKKVVTPEGHYLWLCEYHVKHPTPNP